MNRNQRRYGRNPSTRNTDNINPRISSPKISVETPKYSRDRPNCIYIPNKHSADQPKHSHDQPKQGNDQPKQDDDEPEQEQDIDQPKHDNDQLKLGNAQLKIGIREVMSPKDLKMKGASDNIAKTNRASSVAPESHSFGQFTRDDLPSDTENSLFQSLLIEQYGFDPIEGVDRALSPVRDIPSRVDHASQYDEKEMLPVFVETFDGSHWHNIDTVDEVEQFISSDRVNLSKETSSIYSPKNIRVSEVPTVKIIAQKFSKFKKNDVELRRLVDKIVCLEYDVFDVDNGAFVEQPVQKMRAFFSVKPVRGGKSCEKVPAIPSAVKHRFNIVDDDLKKLDEKEIEIIDEKIAENKCYLEELERVLRRKQAIVAKKNKTSLDLLSLYEMAKRDNPALHYDFSNTNLLSKAELEDVKELILKTCSSSSRGIRRKTMRHRKGPSGSKSNELSNTENIIMDFF